jgi:hypothetical protein
MEMDAHSIYHMKATKHIIGYSYYICRDSHRIGIAATFVRQLLKMNLI